MNRKRFEELTKELVETCKEELNATIQMDCEINDYLDLIDEDVVDRINYLKEVAYSVSNVEDSLDEDDFSLKDIEKVYDYVDNKPFDDEDEKLEYIAILKGLKEVD